jgi:hypothetical protein
MYQIETIYRVLKVVKGEPCMLLKKMRYAGDKGTVKECLYTARLLSEVGSIVQATVVIVKAGARRKRVFVYDSGEHYNGYFCPLDEKVD